MKSPLQRFPVFLLLGASLSVPAAAQITTRVSVDSSGAEANGLSKVPVISPDGRFVAFESLASNLVPGDGNGLLDIFVHDRLTGQTSLVSVDSGGLQSDAISIDAVLSASGRFVAFVSWATNLVAGDTNAHPDIFVHDRQTGQTTRVSVDSAGLQSNGESRSPSLSADGRFVTFQSEASNLVAGDANLADDVFIHDRQTGLTTCISLDPGGVHGNGASAAASVSADGRWVAFQSAASNLVAGDTNAKEDIFVHDRLTGQTIRVSVDSGGIQGDQSSTLPGLSGDGRYVAFQSLASNLVPGDTNTQSDLFVHDIHSRLTTRYSVGSGGQQSDGASYGSILSGEGRFATFVSHATNLVSGDANGSPDIFVHDRQTGQTTLVSVNSGGLYGNGSSLSPSLSSDGRLVTFHSSATNLVSGDTNAVNDIFVHDRLAFSLAVQGTCPGPITLTLSHATPQGFIALVGGAAGVFVKPTPPCQGIALGIAAPTLRITITADAAGGVSRSFNVPAAACGLTLQAVDAATCTASNAIVL